MITELTFFGLVLSPQDGHVFGADSKPIFLILEILSASCGFPPNQRSNLWIADLGSGSGNVAIAARLFGMNAISIDKSASVNNLVKSRVFKPHAELWTHAYTEIMPVHAHRRNATSAVESYVQPATTHPLPLPAAGDHLITPTNLMFENDMFENDDPLPAVGLSLHQDPYQFPDPVVQDDSETQMVVRDEDSHREDAQDEEDAQDSQDEQDAGEDTILDNDTVAT